MRVGEKEISERAAIVARYADLFTRDAARRAAPGRGGGRRRRRARAALPAAQDLRGGPASRPSSPSARTRSRTRSSPRASTFRGEEMPLRTAQAQLAVLADYADREELGELQADGSRRRSTTSAATAARRRRRSRPSSPGSPTRSRATRRRRASRCASSSARSPTRATLADGVYAALRETLVRAAARPGARRRCRRRPRRLHAPALAARGNYTKERASEVCLETLERARLRPRGRAEHPARPRRPAAEVAARLRDRRPTRRRSST